VAKAIANFEPVIFGVSAGQYENACTRLDHNNICVIEISQDEA
jgi:agmatine deiminase